MNQQKEELENYQQRLANKIGSELPLIQEVLRYPKETEVIHLHAYWAEPTPAPFNKKIEPKIKQDTPLWQANIEGLLGLIATVRLLEEIAPDCSQLPSIVIAGGHATDFQDHPMSEIYASMLRKLVDQSVILSEFFEKNAVSSEKLQIYAENEVKKDKRIKFLAEDTKGTLRFLKQIRKKIGFKEALCIGRNEHLPRIAILARIIGVPVKQISIEAFLQYFYPEKVKQLMDSVEWASQFYESEMNFANIEKRNLSIMKIDRRGILMEVLARILGTQKRIFMHREKQ